MKQAVAGNASQSRIPVEHKVRIRKKVKQEHTQRVWAYFTYPARLYGSIFVQLARLYGSIFIQLAFDSSSTLSTYRFIFSNVYIETEGDLATLAKQGFGTVRPHGQPEQQSYRGACIR